MIRPSESNAPAAAQTEVLFVGVLSEASELRAFFTEGFVKLQAPLPRFTQMEHEDGPAREVLVFHLVWHELIEETRRAIAADIAQRKCLPAETVLAELDLQATLPVMPRHITRVMLVKLTRKEGA